MYVRCVANSNWKLWTTEKRQHRFRITGNIACVPIHAFALHSDTRFFSVKFCKKSEEYFPRLFDIVVISDIPTRYLIFCTKQTRKQSLFLSTTSGTSRDLSRVHSFSRPHSMSLFGNTKRCVVVSFSGATSVQWSDVEHAQCAFSGVCWDYFQVFRRFGCAKWKYCEKCHLPAPKIWNLFFILSGVQCEEFHYDKAISCKCYVQLLIQDVFSVSPKTYQLQVYAFYRLFIGVARIFC